jgi:3-methyladenine DNA glycosylase/8-oxoguanine DNA glycosylase
MTPTMTARSKRALTHLANADPQLAKLIARVGAYRLEVDELRDLYTALARSIVYQQLHGKAAAAIWSRLEALGPAGFPNARALLALHDRSPRALRSAGLSENKLRAMRDLAERTARGELPTIDEAHALDDDALKEKLTAVRGIGPWTVEMLLMFRLGRLDVLPATDFGVRTGFARTFRVPRAALVARDGLPSPAHILARGERWRPYRTVASWYLWRAAEGR